MCMCSFVLCCGSLHLCGRGKGKEGCTCLKRCTEKQQEQSESIGPFFLRKLIIWLHKTFCKVITVPQTMLKALVSLFSIGDSIIRTLSTGELVSLCLWLACHTSITGLALTCVWGISTEHPTEPLWAQACNHLDGDRHRLIYYICS